MKPENQHTSPLTPDQLRAGRRFRSAVISFFDGMTDNDAALLEHASKLSSKGKTDVLVIMCAYDRRASTTVTLPTVLLSPDERWQMLTEAGYHNIFPVTISPDLHTAKEIPWPADPAVLMQHAETVIPGTDIWETPKLTELLKSFEAHAGDNDFHIDKSFHERTTSDHEWLTGLITRGEVSAFRERQGYAFPLGGHVVRGNMIGHTLGYPTANLRLADHMKALPAQGVYVAMVKVAGIWYQAMVNIGIRPTLDMENVTIEAHLFDFSEDIYGEWISISFLERIRDEMRFSSLSELKIQLDKDSRRSKDLLSKCLRNCSAEAFIRCRSIRSS